MEGTICKGCNNLTAYSDMKIGENICKRCDCDRSKKRMQEIRQRNIENPPEKPIEKQCSKCKVVKKINEFTNCISNPDSLSYICKSCLKEVNKR